MIIKFAEEQPIPMKIINLSSAAGEKAYLHRPPEDTHSVAELEAVHRAIRFTQQFKQEESLAKMEQQSNIDVMLPNQQINRFPDKQ